MAIAIKDFFLACLIVLSGSVSAADQTVPYKAEPIEIHAKSINARGFLQLLADFADINLVAGDELKDLPLSIDENAIRWDELLDRIARQQSLSARRNEHNLMTIGSACRLDRNHGVPNEGLYRASISLNFQNIPVSIVAQIFSDFFKVPFDVSAVNSHSRITLRVKDMVGKDLLAALAAVQGWTIQVLPKHGIKFIPDEQARKCYLKSDRSYGIGELASDLRMTMLDEPCPRQKLIPTQLACQPLEYFKLDELHFLGSIKLLSRPLVSAIVVAPNGFLYPVRIGSYVGTDTGVVSEVNTQGIVLKEVFREENGAWKERKIRIPYE